jgi:hypothetical protein
VKLTIVVHEHKEFLFAGCIEGGVSEHKFEEPTFLSLTYRQRKEPAHRRARQTAEVQSVSFAIYRELSEGLASESKSFFPY